MTYYLGSNGSVPLKLDLWEYYNVQWYSHGKIICLFVKSTPKGYNFLDVKTGKLILKKHLYSRNDWFWINFNMKVEKHIPTDKLSL